MAGELASTSTSLSKRLFDKLKPTVRRVVSDGRKTQGEHEIVSGHSNSNRGRRRVRRPRALIFLWKNRCIADFAAGIRRIRRRGVFLVEPEWEGTVPPELAMAMMGMDQTICSAGDWDLPFCHKNAEKN